MVIWQFLSRVPESRERLIAVSFFAPAAWIGFDAVRSLLGGGDAEASPVGIGLAVTSAAAMAMAAR
ncbi:hypothetical protein SAMN05216275_11334 [Streptosporangium canum]|uniref:Uncharacterized protein n=1 Tax=Streptosporangium canum TaxID=324952 RepID=A0A1I3UP53_9ACTN|nr:hypothetical protein [Streptosporangium canum]SFJ84830.1 hypothetical protein SAMN05216275_11334 [Streptosporangium canum]